MAGLGFDVVILAGGTGRRLGGVDKAELDVAGLSLLDRVLIATGEAQRTVVVAQRRPTARPVYWAQEKPAGGGPLAGLGAGVVALQSQPPEDAEPAEVILALATDLPWLGPADVDRLLGELSAHVEADAALFSDSEGRAQFLAGAYRAGPLRSALATVGPLDGAPVRLVLQQLAVVTVPDWGAAGDCDTPDQLAAARAHFHRQG